MSSGMKRLQPREHVLLRPDMYIGSVNPEQTRQWLVSPERKLYIASANIVPGLYKIFDEIITNSSDNKQNDEKRGRNAQMTYIKVNLEKSSSGTKITVQNDGIESFLTYDKEEKMYTPELAFGYLMTSTNYDDKQERVTGGRNGFGAKLTNIYSKWFSVEVVENGQKYVQEWTDNMGTRHEYQLTKVENKKLNYIKISFIPDYGKFKLSDLTFDNQALLTRRVFDIAGCCNNVKVMLNDHEIPVHSFREYVQLIFVSSSPEAVKQHDFMATSAIDEATSQTDLTATASKRARARKEQHWTDEHIAYYEPNPYWSIAVFGSEMHEYQQISFVNSICTVDGGSHVEYVLDNLLTPINDKVKDFLKKQEMKSTKDLTRAQIKQNIFVIVRSLIVKPSFDSQTKTALKTPRGEVKKNLQFDSQTDKDCKNFFKVIGNMPILMQNLATLVSAQQQKALKQTDGQKVRHVIVPKLDDAIDAGTGNGNRCYLYLTEGDSAKTLAVEGISKLQDGRRFNGVFPLRGKVLNVRDCAIEKVKENIEISNLKKILGLRQDLDYSNAENRKTLRYGKVVIMADQDTDGSHIKGLLLNLFDTYWPALLKAGYVQEFITPIVRVKSKKSQKDVVDFYSLPEHTQWLADCKNPKDYSTQYYKGLGSSDKSEAIEYFKKIQQNKKQFVYDESSSLRLNMAFNKKLADKRKDWLRGADPTAFLDNNRENINITDFVDKELVLYELENIKRSIPSMIDGFKPSQRKIIFACFKRKLSSAIKVSQLSGYVSEHAAYHHGEQSLNATIVNLAQGFTGANNIPLLVPKGQFGSRPRGGKDSAAPRYIFTQLQPITRYIFREEDDAILTEQKDDNLVIEPEFYVPVIPLILVNGGAGIGTGWSTSVPQFNPLEVINAVRTRLYGKTTKMERYGIKQLQPWYRNWQGNVQTSFVDIQKQKVEKWVFQGAFEVLDDKTLVITELPPGVWTEEYKEDLLKWISDKEKATKRPELIGINDYSDNDKVNMHILLDKSCTILNHPNQQQVLQTFNMEQSIRVSNMMLHDENLKLQQYHSASHILDAFVKVRKVYYQKRKDHLLQQYKEESLLASEKARFIKMIIENELRVQNTPLLQLSIKLWEHKFMPVQMDRLRLLSNRAEGIDDEATDQDKADQKEAEELLKKNVKDIQDKDLFFSKIKRPEDKVITKIYSYLIRLAIQSLTKEKYEELLKDQQIKEEKYDLLKNKTIEQLWLWDLAALELAYKEFEINFQNNKTEKTINIQFNQIQKCVEDNEKAMLRLQNALEEDNKEPELIIEQKQSRTKVDKRPSLLKGNSDQKSENSQKSEKDQKVNTVQKPKSAPKKKKIESSEDEDSLESFLAESDGGDEEGSALSDSSKSAGDDL